METTEQVWRHKTSGELFIVLIDETGGVVQAVQPYSMDDLNLCLTDGWNDDPELAEAINEDQDQYDLAVLYDEA